MVLCEFAQILHQVGQKKLTTFYGTIKLLLLEGDQ